MGQYGDWSDHFDNDREAGMEIEKPKPKAEPKGPKGAKSVEDWLKGGGKVTKVPTKKSMSKSELVNALLEIGQRESALRLQNWGEMDDIAKSLHKGTWIGSPDDAPPVMKEDENEVAPKNSTNRKTYTKEFCKSDEIVVSFYDDGSVDIETGENVPESYFEKACEYLEKKEWSPKSEHKSKSGGLTQKGVDSYKRANPGSKLKTAVTESKPKGKRAARRKSFCARNKGQIDMHNIDCRKNPDKRACLARKKWKCKN